MKSIIEEILQARKEHLIKSTVMPKELLLSVDNLKLLHAYLSDTGLINSNYTKPIDVVGSTLYGMEIVYDTKIALHIR